MAASQDGRSQHDNKDKAMKALVSRIYDFYQQQHDEQVGSERKVKLGLVIVLKKSEHIIILKIE